MFFFPFFINRKFLIKKILFGYDPYDSNLLINAAGGSNIGVYKDWIYLLRIFFIIKMYSNIKLVSFGNSIQSSSNCIFDYNAKKILNKFNFLLVRESLSKKYLDKLQVKCIQNPDIVFSPYLKSIRFNKYDNLFKFNKVAVCCFNDLQAWHKNFKNINLTSSYLSIVDILVKNNFHILLLPQLYGSAAESYESPKYYSNFIKDKKNITLVENSLDVQRQLDLVSRSHIVVSSRYHTLVYALKNAIPFISLPYENKMKGLLIDTNLSKFEVDLLDKRLLSKFTYKIGYILKNYEIISNDLNEMAVKLNKKLQSIISKIL
jgi:polysaccharide pyruvyl transferase WcaK-like protein